jgi:hypothetical protein
MIIYSYVLLLQKKTVILAGNGFYSINVFRFTPSPRLLMEGDNYVNYHGNVLNGEDGHVLVPSLYSRLSYHF